MTIVLKDILLKEMVDSGIQKKKKEKTINCQKQEENFYSFLILILLSVPKFLRALKNSFGHWLPTNFS